MEEKELIKTIADQALDFIVQLRSYHNFDASRFRSLMNSLQLYKVVVENEDNMSRLVAYMLLTIVTNMIPVIRYYYEADHKDRTAISKAYQELWNVIDQITIVPRV